jgi:quinolinate synthase
MPVVPLVVRLPIRREGAIAMNAGRDNPQELVARIGLLRRDRNAILLAHNYQLPEIQNIADLCGDSLELSMKASETDADVILFCGVHFMAETASILSPDKTVLLPVETAGCPMADTITGKALRDLKAEMGEVEVISYINTTAEVKAESDICCTSANAVSVANSVDPRKKILMTPDRNLAMYTRELTGRDIQYWDGCCPIHDGLSALQAQEVKAAHPDALFLAHPECPPEILDLADVVKSTAGMLSFVSESDNGKFIIGTEAGILYPLSQANPDKVFIPADPGMVCADMKKTGLREVLSALEEMAPVVKVPEEIRIPAKRALDRMLAVPRD